MNKYEEGMTVLDGWELRDVIGSGASGTVYEAEKENLRCAVKIIQIPYPGTNPVLPGNRTDRETVLKGYVDEVLGEIDMMRTLCGQHGIVQYLDHQVIRYDEAGSPCWDILIRMELLISLQDYLYDHYTDDRVPDKDIIHVGKDIAKGLEACQRMGIVHRDIKPANILYDETKDEFKLSDFGIARTMEKASAGLSSHGTLPFISPEVYAGKKYDQRADIYGLGLVLYWLANGMYGPFESREKTRKGYGRNSKDAETANTRRLNGDAISGPKNGSDNLSRFILKCIEFDPRDRYRNASEMLKALGYVEQGKDPSRIENPVKRFGRKIIRSADKSWRKDWKAFLFILAVVAFSVGIGLYANKTSTGIVYTNPDTGHKAYITDASQTLSEEEHSEILEDMKSYTDVMDVGLYLFDNIKYYEDLDSEEYVEAYEQEENSFLSGKNGYFIVFDMKNFNYSEDATFWSQTKYADEEIPPLDEESQDIIAEDLTNGKYFDSIRLLLEKRYSFCVQFKEQTK